MKHIGIQAFIINNLLSRLVYISPLIYNDFKKKTNLRGKL